jgi:hypothetical protein
MQMGGGRLTPCPKQKLTFFYFFYFYNYKIKIVVQQILFSLYVFSSEEQELQI